MSDNAYNSDFGTFLADSDYERAKVKKLQENWGHPLRTSVCGWSDLFSEDNSKQGGVKYGHNFAEIHFAWPLGMNAEQNQRRVL